MVVDDFDVLLIRQQRVQTCRLLMSLVVESVKGILYRDLVIHEYGNCEELAKQRDLDSMVVCGGA